MLGVVVEMQRVVERREKFCLGGIQEGFLEKVGFELDLRNSRTPTY